MLLALAALRGLSRARAPMCSLSRAAFMFTPAVVRKMTPPLLEPLYREDLPRWSTAAKSVSLADSDAAYGSLPPYARARFFLSNGVLYKADARCVYRRDEVTAWALVQLLERYPSLPDFDIVLNCRDGPLLRRPNPRERPGPLVISYSATGMNAEIAFPDYTLWGLPGKIKPWAQLRLDLLHRAQVPFARRPPRLIATGVINDYHSSPGVHARQALMKCAARTSGAAGVGGGARQIRDAASARLQGRLDIRYHSLYFERFYSTEEHCAYRYILLAPGSHAVWLDHMKQKLLCGSLVLLLEPSPRVAQSRFQYDVLTRLLVPGVHYVSIPMPDLSNSLPTAKRAEGERLLYERVHANLDWADANPTAAETIARNGKALVRDALTMDAIYAYMAAVLTKAGGLLSYATPEAMEAHRVIGTDPRRMAIFNASNISRVPTDPVDLLGSLRNDSFVYPASAQIRKVDWEAAVLRFNYTAMGRQFTRTARALQEEVRRLRLQSQQEEAARRSAATQAAQGDRREIAGRSQAAQGAIARSQDGSSTRSKAGARRKARGRGGRGAFVQRTRRNQWIHT